MQLTSSAFQNNQDIPSVYTCDGKGINPPLEFGDIPAGTKSLALLVYDPDVPKNLLPSGLYVHWVVYNMPPDTTSIAENSTPPGVQGNNGSGQAAYAPPCPPDKQHHYFFEAYALDTMLDLKAGASKDDLETAMQGHIVQSAQLLGLYNKISNRN